MTDKSEKESRLINNIKTIEEAAILTAIVRPIDVKSIKSGKSRSRFTIVKDDEGVDK